MRLIIGSDHAGIFLRENLVTYLKDSGYDVTDCGAQSTKANYSVEGIKVGENIAIGNYDFGIIICGTGIGISIACNKVKKVRAALCLSPEYAKLAREHNNANVLALGARYTNLEEAIEIVNTFLVTNFEGGRHEDRVGCISDYEDSCCEY